MTAGRYTGMPAAAGSGVAVAAVGVDVAPPQGVPAQVEALAALAEPAVLIVASCSWTMLTGVPVCPAGGCHSLARVLLAILAAVSPVTVAAALVACSGAPDALASAVGVTSAVLACPPAPRLSVAAPPFAKASPDDALPDPVSTTVTWFDDRTLTGASLAP